MADIGINVILTGLESLGEGLKSLGADAQESIGKIALNFKGLGEKIGDLKDRFKAFLSEKWDQLWTALKTGAAELGVHLEGMGKKLATVAAVAAGAGLAAFATAKKFATVSDEMKVMGERFGLTTEQMSRFDYIAKTEGQSVETLASTFAQLAKNMATMQSGTKAGDNLAEKFEKYGISVKDAQGNTKTLEQMILDISDAMAQAGTPGEKLSLITDLLGARAAKLVPIFGDGAEGIRKMMEESDKFGYTISTKMGEDGERFNKALAKMELQLQGFFRKGLTPVMEGFSKLMTNLSDIVGDTDFASKAFTGFLYVLKGLGTGLSLISRSLTLVGQAFGALFASVAAAAKGNFKDAINILGAGVSDIGSQFSGMAKDFEKIWKDTTDGVAKDSDKAAKSIKKLEDGVKGAAKAMKQSAQTSLPQFAEGLQKVAYAMGGDGGKDDSFVKVDTRMRGTMRKMSQEQQDGFDRMVIATSGFATEFSSQLNNMLWDTQKNWKDFFKSLGQFITGTLLQEYISIPLAQGLKQMMGSMFGQAAGSMFKGGGGGGSNLQAISGVAAAGGGIIPSGSWALVGERGPELLAPAAGSRSVIPNHALGGGGGVTINQVFNAGVTQADIARIIPAIRQQTMSAMIDAGRRGG
jgi:hypothetical protein